VLYFYRCTGLTPQDRVIDSPPETLRTGDTVQLAAAAPSSTASAPGIQ
jgi:hypothetical protein